MNRKTPANINPVQVAAHALKNVKTRQDYNRIAAANTQDDFNAAWQLLSEEDRIRIYHLCSLGEPDLQSVADQLVKCSKLLELQVIKSTVGPEVAKQAWKLITPEERVRLKAICQSEQPMSVEETQQTVSEQQPQHQDVSEIPATYPENAAKVNAWLEKEGLSESKPQPKSRTLFSISDDLEKLNDLLDEVGDDAQQQQLINDWLETLGHERDVKLDNYSALIVEMTSRASARKAEAQRLMELAQADENRAKLLKDRLKWFFETHGLKTIDTARYRLTLAKNGGKKPLILDQSVPANQLPEQFQRVSVDPDTTAIREALERGEQLPFAQLGERGTSMRIK